MRTGINMLEKNPHEWYDIVTFEKTDVATADLNHRIDNFGSYAAVFLQQSMDASIESVGAGVAGVE